jgi:hypothetical protein
LAAAILSSGSATFVFTLFLKKSQHDITRIKITIALKSKVLSIVKQSASSGLITQNPAGTAQQWCSEHKRNIPRPGTTTANIADVGVAIPKNWNIPRITL